MRKYQIFIVLILMVVTLMRCTDKDVSLKLKNNSNYAIAFDSSLDTVMDSVSIDIDILLRDMILPGKTVTMIKPGDSEGWFSLIKNSTNKKLNYFIMNIDTIQKYNDWNYIRKNKLYKRYEYTEEELNKKAWVIEYP